MFTKESVHIGFIHSNPGHLTNFLPLVLKQYVFACKCKGDTPNFAVYLDKVRAMQSIEKYNAQISGKCKKHIIKWAPCTGIPLIKGFKTTEWSVEEYYK